MANYVYLAASIDGYIAAEDGGLDWLFELPNPDDGDFGFADFMTGIDALVMGRNTFETVVEMDIWPYEKPVFVLSATLEAIPASHAGKADIVRGTPHEVVAQMRERGYNNLYIDGGKTIQGFLREDLIDELIITQIPVVLGRGIPLFAPMDRRLKFKYVKNIVYYDAAVKVCYRRERDTP